jgi:hypothetical protein
MKIGRKDFLKTTVIAVGAAVGLADIGSCGGDDSGGTGGGAGAAGGTGGSGGTPGSGGAAGSDAATAANACATHEPVETILANHGHLLTVSMADAAAGIDKTYNIQGTADHPHSVTISAALFVMLRAGTTISTMSSTDSSHSHTITVVCA